MEAVLRQGHIELIGPLPREWVEGIRLRVDPLEEDCDIDAWHEEMEQLCADSSKDDEAIMMQTIETHRREAKRQMRVQMGLSE